MERDTETSIYMGIGRYLIAVFFLVESSACLLNPLKTMNLIPIWVPFPTFWIFLFGLLWLFGAVSFILNTWTRVSGAIMALFIVVIAAFDALVKFSSADQTVMFLTVTQYIAMAGGSLMVSTSGTTFNYSPNNGLYVWGRILVGIFFLTAGIMHLTNVNYDATMIASFPWAKGLVIFTGLCWLATALSFWSNIMSRLAGILASILILVITFSITTEEFSMAGAWNGIYSLGMNIGLIGCALLSGACGTILPTKSKR